MRSLCVISLFTYNFYHKTTTPSLCALVSMTKDMLMCILSQFDGAYLHLEQ
jgi:hypothetical protein